jgi:hypothetical protein
MAYAGHKVLVKVTANPVALTNEATTKIAGTTIPNSEYQITNADKRILPPKEAIIVKKDGIVVANGFTLNRLDGRVIFAADQGAAAVITVSGNYLPLTQVAEAYEFTYTIEADNQEKPVFGDQWNKRLQALKDLSVELSQWNDVNFTLFRDALEAEETLVMEFLIEDQLDLRCWVLGSTDEVSASADALVEQSLEFEGTTDNEGRTLING